MFLISDILKMIRDIGRYGTRGISMWGRALNLPQLFGGIIFITTIEGQLVLVSAVIMLIIAGQIHKRTPFSLLTGLGQIPWLALAPWLLYQLQTVEHGLIFQLWGYYVSITMVISLLFVAYDLYRYATGMKTYPWARIP